MSDEKLAKSSLSETLSIPCFLSGNLREHIELVVVESQCNNIEGGLSPLTLDSLRFAYSLSGTASLEGDAETLFRQFMQWVFPPELGEGDNPYTIVLIWQRPY